MARTKQVARHARTYYHPSSQGKSVQSSGQSGRVSIGRSKASSSSSSSSPSDPGKLLAKRRHRPGAKVTRSYLDYQAPQETVINWRDFARLIREVARRLDPQLRFQESACRALQQAAEAYLADLFANAKLLANHAKRVTVYVDDVDLVRQIRREITPRP